MRGRHSVLLQLVLFLFSFLLYSCLPPSVFADSINAITISDAVYADLAVRGYLDNISVSYVDGNPANIININETRYWLPASTVKLFAAMYAFKQIANHTLDPYNGSIQVIEKAQDTKKTNQPSQSHPSQPSQQKTSQSQQSNPQPQKSQAASQPVQSTKKEDKKDK